MEQHFRPTLTDPGYDVVTENRYFVDGDGVEWEELSFSVNGSKWGADRPPFPLLQPEKVLSLPLQLRFDEGYRYRLDGTERVDDFDCYVVRFEPIARRRVALSRHGLDRPPDVRAGPGAGGAERAVGAGRLERGDRSATRRSATIGNQPVFLFSGLTARQIVLIAGRNLLVEKRVAFTRLPRQRRRASTRARAAARASDRIMYPRDRSRAALLRQGGRRSASSASAPTPRRQGDGDGRDARSVVRVSAADLRHQLPRLRVRRTRTRSSRCCLPACSRPATSSGRSSARRRSTPASTSSRLRCRRAIGVYDAGGEREGERRADLAAVDRPQPRMAGTRRFRRRRCSISSASTATSRDRTTVGDVRRAVEHGHQRHRRRLGIPPRRLQRRARTAPGSRAPAGSAWGAAGDAGDRSPARYAKYTRERCRATSTSTSFQKIHLNGAWFGGRDLDRFAKYQFGMFDDTRIHGVPGVRRPVRRAGDGARLVFAQHLRAVPARPVPRAGLGPRRAASTRRGSRSPASAPPSTSARPGIRSCGPTSARACCRTAIAASGSTTLQVMLLKPLAMTPTRCRADLHVTRCHSTVQPATLPFLRSRDCYSRPEDVYRVAKARGMDLVAITDHDSIDGALELLDAHPDAPRRHRRRGSVVLVAGRRHRSAPRRLRHDRSAAPRRCSRCGGNVFDVAALPARGGRLLRAESSAALLSRADAARRRTCGCSTRCRRSKRATARCCRRTTS